MNEDPGELLLYEQGVSTNLTKKLIYINNNQKKETV
jgi:hypothetical protein